MGGGSWIVKLPSTRFPVVPENEYTLMALARRIGIEVPRTDLIDSALLVRRCRHCPNLLSVPPEICLISI
jgi:hypothetical protein